MEDMWRNRTKPTALDFDKIQDGILELPIPPQSSGLQNGDVSKVPKLTNGVNNVTPNGSANGAHNKASVSHLKDQKELSLLDNLELFVSRRVLQYQSSLWG